MVMLYESISQCWPYPSSSTASLPTRFRGSVVIPSLNGRSWALVGGEPLLLIKLPRRLLPEVEEDEDDEF